MRRLLISEIKPGEVDKLWGLIVLAQTLAGEKIDIYIPNWPSIKQMAHHLPLGSLNFVEKLDDQHLTISIKRNDSKVKEVKWEETDELIKVLIFTEAGTINTKEYEVKPAKPNYSELIVYGISTMAKLKLIIGEFAPLLETATIHNIDRASKNERFGEHNFVQPETRSFAELVNNYLEHHELDPKPSSASLLLAGLLWRTNGLSNEQTVAESFSAASNLLAQGASLSQANRWLHHSRSLLETKAIGEIYTNMRLIKDGKIVISKVSSETAKQLGVENLINPSQNPLKDLVGPNYSIILYPQASSTLVRVSSSEPLSKVKKLLRDLHPWTSPDSLLLRVDMNIEQAEALIVSKLTNETKVEVTPEPAKVIDPLLPATEEIVPEPAVEVEPPKPLFGGGGAGGNPFGPI